MHSPPLRPYPDKRKHQIDRIRISPPAEIVALVANRLLKRARRETLQALAADLGIAEKDSTQQLAEQCSEKLHFYDTDSDDDDDGPWLP